MANFKPVISDIEAKLSSIVALFSQVLEKNHAFAAMRHQNEASRRREQALKEVDESVVKFTELARVVAEGSRFYEDMRRRIDQLALVVDDFSYVRGVERDEFAASGARRASHAASDAGDYATVPVAWSAPAASSSSSTASAPSYSPPPAISPPVAAVSNPNPLGLTPDKARALGAMRDFLGIAGTEQDRTLVPLLERAHWDVNVAVNAYLETPPPAAAKPVALANVASSSERKKSGWFR